MKLFTIFLIFKYTIAYFNNRFINLQLLKNTFILKPVSLNSNNLSKNYHSLNNNNTNTKNETVTIYLNEKWDEGEIPWDIEHLMKSNKYDKKS